jgi:hypothetical protein
MNASYSWGNARRNVSQGGGVSNFGERWGLGLRSAAEQTSRRQPSKTSLSFRAKRENFPDAYSANVARIHNPAEKEKTK